MNDKTSNKEIVKPGPLKFSIKITLNSKEAQALFYGRSKADTKSGGSTIIGLNNFANRMRFIVNAARNDDPYADYFLYQVEKVLSSTQVKLAVKLNDLNSRKDESSLKIKIGGSIKPVVIETEYSSVHANIALELLQTADRVFIEVHTMVHIGLLTRSEGNNYVEEIKRFMRKTFLSQQGYKFVSVNRKDLELMTVKSEQARIAMGSHLKLFGDDELPANILDRTLRAEYAPNITGGISMSELFGNNKGRNPRRMPSPTKTDGDTSDGK